MTFRSGFSYFPPAQTTGLGRRYGKGNRVFRGGRLLSMCAGEVESEPGNDAKKFHPTTSVPESTMESDRKISAVEDKGHIVYRQS